MLRRVRVFLVGRRQEASYKQVVKSGDVVDAFYSWIRANTYPGRILALISDGRIHRRKTWYTGRYPHISGALHAFVGALPLWS